jgi:TonB family protein
MEFLRQWQRGRLAAGIVASIILHLVLLALAVGLRLPGARYDVKRGEPLIVELPKGDDSPPPGPGGAPASTPSPPRAAPPARAPAKPAPPAPKVAAAPAPRPPEPAARPSVRPPEPEPSRQVASAPAAPAPEAAPVPVPQPAPSKPDPPSEPVPSAPAPAAPQPEPARQVASLPPAAQAPARSAPDTLSALRRGSGGGAGGRGEGRAGIEGEPIPLDSKDPRHSDYLDRVRRAIKEKWGFPCVKNASTHECEYKTTTLIIEFGIAKDGKVPFVTVLRSSGYPIYDDYAVNAVKLAAPFPPIPDNFSKTGVPIHATFSYVVESSLANILR